MENNVVRGWRHSVIRVDRRDSIACINLQLSGYASDLNGKEMWTQCGWRHSVISDRSKRFYCMHQSTAVRICFRLKWKKNVGVWMETQLSGYASDLDGRNVVFGWRHSVIR